MPRRCSRKPAQPKRLATARTSQETAKNSIMTVTPPTIAYTCVNAITAGIRVRDCCWLSSTSLVGRSVRRRMARVRSLMHGACRRALRGTGAVCGGLLKRWRPSGGPEASVERVSPGDVVWLVWEALAVCHHKGEGGGEAALAVEGPGLP